MTDSPPAHTGPDSPSAGATGDHPDSGAPDGDRHARDARRRQRIQAVVAVTVLVLVFAVLLPQMIDYGAVWSAVTDLSTGEFAVLLVLGLLRIPVAAGQYASVIPGLTVRESVRSYLAANSVAEFAPPPADLAVRYSMYRAQGIDADSASVGILLTGFFTNAAKLMIPVLALIALLLSGVDDQAVWELAVLGCAALAFGALVVVLALRSQTFALRLGRALGRFISWFLVRFGKNPLEDLGPKAVGLRERVGVTLRTRWPIAAAATVGGHVMSFVIMLVSVRFVGIDASTIGWVDLLVAYSIVLLLTALPLTPGGIGVAAVGYVAILAGGDDALADLIASASLLTRVFTWLLPMAVGFVPLVRWRRAQNAVPAAS